MGRSSLSTFGNLTQHPKKPIELPTPTTTKKEKKKKKLKKKEGVTTINYSMIINSFREKIKIKSFLCGMKASCSIKWWEFCSVPFHLEKKMGVGGGGGARKKKEKKM
jgi:hypothetical protein